SRPPPAQGPLVPGGRTSRRVHGDPRGGTALRVPHRQGRRPGGPGDRGRHRRRSRTQRGARGADEKRGLGSARRRDAGDRRRGAGGSQEGGVMDVSYYGYLAQTIPPREIARALVVRARRALLRGRPFFFDWPPRRPASAEMGPL